MAEKRMFSKKIIDTDWFMDMPATSQNLYFHLSMRADDDGFVASPRRIVKLIGASEDDYKLLIAKKFVITFESGVCVIKDWRINNYLRSDRYTETVYQEEKHLLNIKESGEYEVGIPLGIPEVSTVYISNSNSNNIILDNNEKEENKTKEERHKYGEYNKVLLTDAQYEKLISDFGEENTKNLIRELDEAKEMKGYVYKNDNLAIRKWVVENLKKKGLWKEIKKEQKVVIDTSEQDKELAELVDNDPKARKEFEEFMKSRNLNNIFKEF